MINLKIRSASFTRVATIAIVLVSLGMSGCGKKDENVIKIGVITPLSGEGATYGAATKRGVDLALEEINNSGGVRNRQIQVIYEDSQIDPSEGTKAIQKLINVDKVSVIIGAFGSSVSLAISPIAERSKVVLFSASSTADELKEAGDYFFRNVPTNSAQGQSAADFAVDVLEAQSAAILYMNNDYGISLTKSFKNRFENSGKAIQLVENYNPGDRDFRSQITKIIASRSDVVFYPGHYQESGIILKQAREMGLNIPFIGGDGSYSPNLIAIAGTAAENSYYTLMAMGFGISDEKIENYNEAYFQKYGMQSDVYSAYAYDALHLIVNAIERGGLSSEDIKNALYSTKGFRGITGITTFDSDGEVDKPFYIYKVQNGEFVLASQELTDLYPKFK